MAPVDQTTKAKSIRIPAPASIETSGHIGIITLKHQAKRNALTHDMMHALTEAFARFEAQKIRVAVLRAEPGVKVWSAGHDIGELPLGGMDPLRYTDPMEETLRAIRMFPGPVIAMVHGSVWGGAFDVVLSCDMVFADETATFAITPVNIGLPYNTTGLLHFMGRLGSTSSRSCSLPQHLRQPKSPSNGASSIICGPRRSLKPTPWRPRGRWRRRRLSRWRLSRSN